jgi:hypothetical protein
MSSQRQKSIGDQELALLRFVSDAGRATVAQAVEGFGQPRGLARSTVLTMMERLGRRVTSAGGGWMASFITSRAPPPARHSSTR